MNSLPDMIPDTVEGRRFWASLTEEQRSLYAPCVGNDRLSFGTPAIRGPDGRMHAIAREAFEALAAGGVLVGSSETSSSALTAGEAELLRRCAAISDGEGLIEESELATARAAIARVTER